MSDSSRFAYTKDINFCKLEHEKRPLLFVCFLFSVVFHAILALLITFQPSQPETPTPLTVEILLHQPTRKSPPVFFQSRIIRPRDYIYRDPTPYFPELPSISYESIPHEFSLTPPDTVGLGEMAISSLRYRRTIPEMPTIEPIEPLSVRKPKNEFSKRDELLSAEDYLDIQYHTNSRGIVFYNPGNKHSITGLIYLNNFFTQSEVVKSEGMIHLAENLIKYTDIKAVLAEPLLIGGNSNYQWPFVLLASGSSWDYVPSEVEAIRQMVKNGVFIMLEAISGEEELSPKSADASFRAFIKDAFGSTARISIIPKKHPLFYCYFDFDEVPVLNEYDYADIIVEGIFIDGRLVGILSNQGYSKAWSKSNSAAARLSVNIIVYALRRSDGNAIKRQDANLVAGKRGDQMKLLDFNP